MLEEKIKSILSNIPESEREFYLNLLKAIQGASK